MERTVFVAGSGGHGIQNIGKTLVHAALSDGLEATCYPRYGIEKRGGYSSCYLTFSEGEIGNVKKARSDVVILIDQRAYNMFGGTVRPGGCLIVNSSAVKAEEYPAGCRVLELPIIDMALQFGDLRAISTIITGLVAGIPGLFSSAEPVRQTIAEKWKNKPAVLEMNLNAFDAGLPLGTQIRLEAGKSENADK